MEGWSAGGASCAPIALLCTSEATYDAAAGHPPGSIAMKTTVTLNLVSLFKGTATWNSPQFTVPVDAITGADVGLDRAFSPGGLVDVEPEATYTVALADVSAGTSTTVLSEEVDDESGTFAATTAPVAVVGGHTYRLSIEGMIGQSALALSLLTGTATLGFDNVGLTVHSAAGGGGGGGAKGGDRSGADSSSLSSRRLLSLLRGAGAGGPVVLKGERLLVRVSCPRPVGGACQIAAQGMLARGKPATRKRVVRVGGGKGRRIVLRVKPGTRQRLAKRKRLLVREKGPPRRCPG